MVFGVNLSVSLSVFHQKVSFVESGIYHSFHASVKDMGSVLCIRLHIAMVEADLFSPVLVNNS